MKILISLPLLFALVGCAGFDKSSCDNKKLHAKGLEQAKSGKTDAAFKDLALKCQEQGITMDTKEYQRGFKQGLKEFCTKKSAFKYGLDGQTNNGTCPNKNQFSKFYDKGFAIHKVKKDIEAKDLSIIELQKKMNLIKTTAVERKGFEKQIKTLKREKFELETKLNLISKKTL